MKRLILKFRISFLNSEEKLHFLTEIFYKCRGNNKIINKIDMVSYLFFLNNITLTELNDLSVNTYLSSGVFMGKLRSIVVKPHHGFFFFSIILLFL